MKTPTQTQTQTRAGPPPTPCPRDNPEHLAVEARRRAFHDQAVALEKSTEASRHAAARAASMDGVEANARELAGGRPAVHAEPPDAALVRRQRAECSLAGRLAARQSAASKRDISVAVAGERRAEMSALVVATHAAAEHFVKCQRAEADLLDALVARGFELGGHTFELVRPGFNESNLEQYRDRLYRSMWRLPLVKAAGPAPRLT